MEFIQQNIIYVLLALVSGTALIVLTVRKPAGRHGVSASQATLLINREGAQVIDVRSVDEYAAGHLPDSRNIPIDQLDARIGELDKHKESPLIVVCQTGKSSAGACAKLQKQGFARVNSLDGGMTGWRSAGLPVKKGNKK